VSGTDDPVELLVEGHVAWMTLNRPDAMNACTTPLLERITALFDELEERADVRCVVLRGRGRAFCVGADIAERQGMSLDAQRRRRRIAPAAFGAMRRYSRPVIAQVHGYAIGSGLELAMGCDLIVAAAGTVMCLPETAKASIPAGGGTQTLPRLVGAARAKELIFTSRRFTAEEAERWGMVNHVVPAEGLDAQVAALCAEIVAVSPVSCMQAKRAIDRGLSMTVEDGLQLEAELYERVLTSEDRLEAFRAAAEKRQPAYVGR